MKKLDKENISNFLKQSNYIEGEYSDISYQDAKRAFRYALKHKTELNVKHILMIHQLLMKRLNPRIAGKLRDTDVWIAGKRKQYIGQPYFVQELERISQDINGIKNDFITNSEEYAIQKHVEFEELHPFEDGNGRVGRILWQVHRINMGLPIKIILESERQSYYTWFRDKQ